MQTVTKTTDKYGDTYYRNKRHRLHNEEGPAYIWTDGSVSYCINGKLHRTNGPAVIGADGSMQYWINGTPIKSLKEFQKLSNSTEEDMTVMILKYGHDGFMEE